MTITAPNFELATVKRGIRSSNAYCPKQKLLWSKQTHRFVDIILAVMLLYDFVVLFDANKNIATVKRA